jgi:hypothetical protein
MTRILRYILQHDTGMAPCVDNGLVSLATCKPKIRAGARSGEWVIGFRPSPAPRGLVVWAGRVAHSVGVGEYERQYRGRSDAVYRAKPGGGFKRLWPDYHPGQDEFWKDVSSPVLVFDPDATWYFGREPYMLPEHLTHLAAGGRGHRVNGVNDGDAAELQAWLASLGPPGVHGVPRDGTPKRPPLLLGARRASMCR